MRTSPHRTVTRSRWLGAVALGLAATLFAACGSDSNSGSPSGTGDSSGTSGGPATTTAGGTEAPDTTGSGSGRTSLVIGSTLAPPTLDITTGSGAAIPAALLYNVFETLVKIDEKGEYQPLLAEKYEVSDDGLTYTFHLRQGVTFQNGQPFDSSDVKFSFDNSIANLAKGTAPGIISATFAPVASVEAPDANTVVVTLKQRSRNFLFNIAQTGGVVVDQTSLPAIATKPVGTGPFEFVSYSTNDNLKLKRYDGYWGTKPSLENVEFRYIGDPKTMADSIRSPGGVDLIDNLTPELFKTFQDDPDFQTINIVTNGETILAINNSRKPLDDVRVRQAISYAIDKKAVNEIAESGFAQIIGTHSSPNDPWYLDLSDTYQYDPDKAKELLQEAGVSDLKLTLQVPPVPYATSSAEVVRDNLADVGIDVTLKDIEFPLWIDQVFTKADYDLTIISHVEARDVDQYGNPGYYWRYDSPKVQDLLKQADAAPTDAESDDLYHQVLRQINEDAVNDWLFLLPGLTVAKKDITGIPNASYSLSYDLTRIK
jgi:peptide/nickel transport system substrate-binding protein